MLSNIGRAAVRRIGAGNSHASTNRVLQSIWRLQRVGASEGTEEPSAGTQFALPLRRLYATATRTIKKPATTAKKVVAAKAKPKKKVVSKKKVAKKPAAKKPKPKKRKAVAKPKKVKKVLTVEQKAKLAQKKKDFKEKENFKTLKATALLDTPKGKPYTAWTVLVAEKMPKGTTSGATQLKEISQKWKSLTPEELEHYNHIANQNKKDNEIALKQWMDSHTPDEIRLANNARLLLKKRTGKARSFATLKDDRQPKHPVHAFGFFNAERWASGDFKGVSMIAATALLLKEYEALSDVARKVYEDRAAADKQRYIQEYKTVFHRESPGVIKKAKAAA